MSYYSESHNSNGGRKAGYRTDVRGVRISAAMECHGFVKGPQSASNNVKVVIEKTAEEVIAWDAERAERNRNVVKQVHYTQHDVSNKDIDGVQAEITRMVSDYEAKFNKVASEDFIARVTARVTEANIR